MDLDLLLASYPLTDIIDALTRLYGDQFEEAVSDPTGFWK